MAIDPNIPFWTRALISHPPKRRRASPMVYGPEVISGPSQSVESDAGRWRLEFEQTRVNGARILPFRALVLEITSPLRPIYVPICDWRNSPRRRVGLSPGTGFADQPIDFEVSAVSAARSTTLRVTRIGPASVQLFAGNIIGLGGRSYAIRRIAPAGGTAFDLTIWPYLREAAAIGDDVFTEDPVVKCMADKSVGDILDELDDDIVGYVDIRFEEARW